MNRVYHNTVRIKPHLLLPLVAAVNACLLTPINAQETASPVGTPAAFGDANGANAPNGANTDAQPMPSVSDQMVPTRQTQSSSTNLMPQIRTSNETAVDAGLVPVFSSGASSGIATSATATGLVSSFPGLTSFGAQAASAASTAKQPLGVYASQTLAYIDNPGQFAGNGQIGGLSNSAQNAPDEYEVTSFDALYSRQLGQQELFASANFSLTNYFHDSNFDSTQYSLSIGDNYALGDVCAGTIVANQSQSAVPLQFLQGSLTAQTSKNSSIEASSRCRVTGHFSVLSDFRLSDTSFSDPTSAANDSKQIFGSGSLEYAVPQFAVFGILASIQQSEFARSNSLQTAGLSNNTSQLNFSAYLTKPITAKLNLSLSAGVADLATGGPTLSGALQPVYTATASYSYSPKTSFNANLTHSIGSPQNLLTNFQQIDSISFGVSYRFSPKTSFTVSAGGSKTSGSDSGVNTTTEVGLNSTNIFEQVGVGYRIAQSLSASLSYQHLELRQSGFDETAKTNIVSLSLNYAR